MGKIIDALYDYHFNKKYKNPYTDKARDTIFYSLLYKALNTDQKQANRERQEKLEKMRGF